MSLLEGTAYFLYGQRPACLPDQLLSKFRAHTLAETPTESSPPPTSHSSRDPHHHCGHGHSRKSLDTGHDTPAWFWAVFQPSKITIIEQRSASKVDRNDSVEETAKSPCFYLMGTPRPWGEYPSDMPVPHGCIPPHLYYSVDMFSTEINSNSQGQRLREWSLPFVHRFGDGRDDAGGLTTGYHRLQDLDDADDFGQFLDQLPNQPAAVTSSSLNEHHHKENKDYVQLPALYASTQVLASETRTMTLIQDHFLTKAVGTTPVNLTTSRVCQFQEQIKALVSNHHNNNNNNNNNDDDDDLNSVDQELPLWVLISDLRMILPSP
ncbi:hypothetical protein BGW38_002021 [Lunasporangiospora selenospora]|uniref:Uncharacterized protein n=1 Tax=Lunasporangiospora selenospora TaxID=979761 RepID=A0A9P6FUS3_9FUNG|nr:hypothetical protein BGW38_002021 [Lunasporangiospora selenospora]